MFGFFIYYLNDKDKKENKNRLCQSYNCFRGSQNQVSQEEACLKKNEEASCSLI